MGKGKVKAAQRKAASKTADEMLASEAEDDMTTNSTIGDHDSSTVGGETAGSPFPSLPTKGVDIDEAMEWLVEKRATTREKGLKALAAHFRSSLDSEDDLAVIEEHMETLTTNLLRFVKRPAAAREGKLSLELLSLLALYKGADDAELLEAFEKPLKALIVASGETDDAMKELRVTALSCLALVGFVCGGADAQDELWMYFEEMIHGETTDASGEELPLPLRAAAVDAWVLLATVHSCADVLSRASGSEATEAFGAAERFSFVSGSGNTLFEALQELLGHPSAGTDVKIAAGKCYAYLWEVAFESLAGDGDDDEGTAAVLAASVSEAGRLLCHNSTTVSEVLSDIREISKDCSKRISKKDRKEQRAEFRDVEELLFNGAAPFQMVRVQGTVLELRSFAEMRIYEAMKEPLASGFHSAVRMYPVLRAVFGVTAAAMTGDMDGGGQQWKVSKKSSVQKRRTTDRKLERRYRAASAMLVPDS